MLAANAWCWTGGLGAVHGHCQRYRTRGQQKGVTVPEDPSVSEEVGKSDGMCRDRPGSATATSSTPQMPTYSAICTRCSDGC